MAKVTKVMLQAELKDLRVKAAQVDTLVEEKKVLEDRLVKVETEYVDLAGKYSQLVQEQALAKAGLSVK